MTDVYEQIAAEYARLIPDDDAHHPLTVLGTWEMAFREDYGQPCDHKITVTSAAKYLDGMLSRIANDETQDWALFARELRDCCNHLEAVVHTLRRPEQGVPCPECSNEDGAGPRLTKHYVEHDRTGASDWWGCVAVREHSWPDYVYRKWVADVYLEQADRLTASQIASQYGIPAGTIRQWVVRGTLDKAGYRDGRVVYNVEEVKAIWAAKTPVAQ